MDASPADIASARPGVAATPDYPWAATRDTSVFADSAGREWPTDPRFDPALSVATSAHCLSVACRTLGRDVAEIFTGVERLENRTCVHPQFWHVYRIVEGMRGPLRRAMESLEQATDIANEASNEAMDLLSVTAAEEPRQRRPRMESPLEDTRRLRARTTAHASNDGAPGVSPADFVVSSQESQVPSLGRTGQ